MNVLFKKSLPHLGALAIFMLLTVAYFYPQVNGKVIQPSDLIQYQGMAHEAEKIADQTGELPLWTNAMFGGMPTYQIKAPFKGNLLTYLDRALRFGIEHPIGRFFIAMISFYILMISLGADPWLGIISAIAFSFTTNNFSLYETGHITKLRAISYFPLVAAGMIVTYRGKLLWGGLLFAAGLGLNIVANHPQMTYFLALTFPIYVIAQLVNSIRNKKAPDFLKATAVLAIAGLLAIGSDTANLWTTYEYSKETMRGEPILQSEAATETRPASSSETDGLAWDYAMQWSNGVIDLFSSFIPGVAGGGSAEPLDGKSAIVRDLRQKGANLPADFSFPLYWGGLPFTSGPIYFGAAIILLFIMGITLVKGPVKWWLTLGTLLIFLFSLGKNLAWFNEFFFNHFPLFNKFRTPNSNLAVASFLIPLLGLLAVKRIFSRQVSRKEILRSLFLATGITAGASLFFWLLGPSLFDFSNPADERYIQMGVDVNTIIADRQALMRSDALRSLVIVLVTASLIWAFVQDKIKRHIFLIGLGLVILLDLWTVGRRYLNANDFTTKNTYEANFRPRPVDEQILRDTEPNFRVYDLTINTFQNSRSSYFYNTIGGYHAAKLQRIQDLIDRHLSQGNQAVIDMLNTKYFIVQGDDGQPRVQQNPGALGPAWFVDTIRLVDSPNAEIDALNGFDPATTAIVNREFSDQLSGFNPSGSGTIRLTNYRPDHLTYQTNNPGEGLAVFSEIWYNPRKGWNAYIDGQPAELIRADYALRALRIPPGEHEVILEFHPRSYYTGRTLASLFSGIILLGILGFIGFQGYQTIRQEEEQPAAEKPKSSTSQAKQPKEKKPGRKGRKRKK